MDRGASDTLGTVNRARLAGLCVVLLGVGAATASACRGGFCSSWSSALLCDDFDNSSNVAQEGLQQQISTGGGTFVLNNQTAYTPPNSALGTTIAFEGGSGSAAELGGSLWKDAQPPPAAITCQLEVQAAQLSDASSDMASVVTLVIMDGTGLVRSELSVLVDTLGNFTFQEQAGGAPMATNHSGDPPDGAADAPAEVDGGMSDGGSSLDSGSLPSDSGSPSPESGPAPDSGSAADSGTAQDSAPAPDTGIATPDSGALADVGSDSDSGSAPDSGAVAQDGGPSDGGSLEAGASDAAGDAQSPEAEAPDVELTDAPVAASVLGTFEAGSWTFVEIALTTTSSGTQFSVTAGGAAVTGNLSQPLPSPMSATLLVGPVARGASSSGWSMYYDNVVCH